MPPAIRTLPSGSSVALWPERGLSIGPAAAIDPTRVVDGCDARKAIALSASVMMQATNSRRERIMMSSSGGQTLRVVVSEHIPREGAYRGKLCSHQVSFFARLVLDDVARDRAGRDRQR